ncbi:cysteine--tRNA ligase [Bradyrhizobium sp. U87765 SZCCT0131]|uniref:cysteine--tRNA ligase n=1 Tax=unclassified Bradyrhizobium TaxID=2631580 RepID=UPI001BACDB44|nr:MULTISPECIES: cysteine--tRNA ligase [unclassified Bradyrhizobium]MBR1221439.1 cysteine--tRNA ligase [Bradyrhizobium sp. U87765 SZCCT0131]MBR1264638.1 cysteine--tRNA ligase [Bradyrhizobium sp. U87765 SZCCT0134]MBR1304456.1 cysteine--tRNA ligase [Bradyrhizobium sp. U87765 SZCCT0110]MBR1322687.1 cysteine--tRNA ligase [Bradyrhizobium sp. U87765 SZCCT0109]MBR1346385.1 cysteine--tRNA ligase [Bradyrhizobium sp. U87765 SZCCT0048]
MELKLYDTLSKDKRVFAPLDPDNVRMYVCGPTVYDFAHIGNARPVIVFDVLFRLLRHIHGANHVTYVRNITDVDDKINVRAARDYPGLPLNEAIRRVTEQTERQFHEDVDSLGCLRPTVEPRATEHIAEMAVIIEKLIAGGHAYVAEDHVLFAVATMPSYGELAKRTLDEMMAGARVDVASYKRDEMDFVLWKPSKPGEPSWPSPGGIAAPGRPGWHIECSAMAWKHLGEQFDIHGGGIDLVFPHHENERAQSCCAFHHDRMANVWMHNGFLQVEGEKMSKSLGNFITIHELLRTEKFGGASWAGDVLRLAMLRTHYRSPIDWTVKALDESHKALWDWNSDIGDIPASATVPAHIVEALCDDLNVSKAITAMHALRKEKKLGDLRAAMNFLGFGDGRDVLARRSVGTRSEFINMDVLPSVAGGRRQHERLTDAEIGELVEARTAARGRKDFRESDRIRDELAAVGVVLKDGKDADGKPVTTWEIAR